MYTSSKTSEFPVTMAVTGATSTSATLNGSVNANYLPTSVSFEYGNLTLYGNTIPSIPGQVTGNEFISVNAGLSGLTLNTTYHYRLKIINSSGTAFETICNSRQNMLSENKLSSAGLSFILTPVANMDWHVLRRSGTCYLGLRWIADQCYIGRLNHRICRYLSDRYFIHHGKYRCKKML